MGQRNILIHGQTDRTDSEAVLILTGSLTETERDTQRERSRQRERERMTVRQTERLMRTRLRDIQDIARVCVCVCVCVCVEGGQ